MQRAILVPPQPSYQQVQLFEMSLKMPMKVTGWINLSASAKQTTDKMPRAVTVLSNIFRLSTLLRTTLLLDRGLSSKAPRRALGFRNPFSLLTQVEFGSRIFPRIPCGGDATKCPTA